SQYEVRQSGTARRHGLLVLLGRLRATIARWFRRPPAYTSDELSMYDAEVPPPEHIVRGKGVQVVIISNDTIDGDNSADWVPQSRQYFEVDSSEQMADLLERNHAPRSIDVLILGGHGERAGAGIRAREPGTGREVYINHAMSEEVAARVRRLLRPKAEVYIAACGSGRDRDLMRELA